MEKYMVRIDSDASKFYESISKYSDLPVERIMSMVLSGAAGDIAKEILGKENNKSPHT